MTYFLADWVGLTLIWVVPRLVGRYCSYLRPKQAGGEGDFLQSVLPGVLLRLTALVCGLDVDDAHVDDLPRRLHRHRLQLPQRVHELVRLVLLVILARLRAEFLEGKFELEVLRIHLLLDPDPDPEFPKG